MGFPGMVWATLYAPGADNTLLDIDTDLAIRRRIRTAVVICAWNLLTTRFRSVVLTSGIIINFTT